MKVRADHIKLALANRHANDFFLTEVKDGPTQTVRNHFKLDALAFKKSWANPAIIGYEVKVDRSDFTRDDKWPAYLPLCNQFSFVCPTGLIQLEELPQEVGLIYYNPENRTLLTKRKAAYRLIEEPINMYKYIIMSKLDTERHPFFSSSREYFEALRVDKAERKRLGYWVAEATGKHINELTEKVQELERKVARLEIDDKFRENVRDVLRESGIGTSYGWEERLRERLSSGVSYDMRIEVERVKNAVDRLSKIIG